MLLLHHKQRISNLSLQLCITGSGMHIFWEFSVPLVSGDVLQLLFQDLVREEFAVFLL